MLKDRAFIRTIARPPKKRNADAQSSAPATPSPKRTKAFKPVADPVPTIAPPAKVPNITASFMDRVTMNQERQVQDLPALPKYDVPRIPNETFYQRGDGVNKNLVISPPNIRAASRKAFTVASEGSFNLEEDINQVEEWLAIMPTEEEEEEGEGFAGLVGFHIHHSLRERGSDNSDTDPEDNEDESATPSMLKKRSFRSRTTDSMSKRQGKAHKRAATQSSIFSSQSQAPMGMTHSRSTSHSSHLATPSGTSPAPPPFTFGAKSSATTVATNQHASMFVFRGKNQHQAPEPSSSPSPPQPVRMLNGPVAGWLATQQGGMYDDDDMPDTDPGESFSQDTE
jgi:hypothetical protein